MRRASSRYGLGPGVRKLAAAQIVGIGLRIVSSARRQSPSSRRAEGELQLIDDGVGQFFLDGEDIGEVAIVAVGPEMVAVCRIDQLPGNANAAVRHADAALKHVADAEFLRELLHLDRAALVGKGGVARNDLEARYLERSVMMSSVIPSEKYSWSGSPLMLVKGRTAM